MAGEKKPRVLLVSACLLGVHCTYLNGHNGRPEILEWIQGMGFDQVIPVCPEQLGGLPTPRPPVEIRWLGAGRFIALTREGEDRTPAFEKGARESLALATLFGATHALLKSRSPSCGRDFIHDQSFSGRLVKNPGVTARTLLKAGLEVIESDEILRLTGDTSGKATTDSRGPLDYET